MMEGRQRLFYALGQLLYAVAIADEKIQKAELEKVHNMIKKASEKVNSDFDIAEIVIVMQSKELVELDVAYNWAMQEIKLCKHYFDQQLKDDFLFMIKEVANAFQGTEKRERNLIEQLEKDLAEL